MKKLTLIAIVFLFGGIATPVSAYMPYEPYYDPIDGECLQGDSPLYESNSTTNRAVEQCIPRELIERANAESARRNAGQDGLTVVTQGQSILLTNGITDTCPAWFPMHCVIFPELVARFL